MGSSDIKPSAAVELSPLLKERPSAAEAKAWCEDNMPKLPADQRALILGLTPRGALQYEADPVPAALVEGAGVTAIMVTQREALRFKCDTSDNLADLLTKALDPIPFDKLRRLVLNILAVGAIYPVPRARRIATKAWRNV